MWSTRTTVGAGAVSHVDHAHHVAVDVLFTITEYIREANRTGGGCTSGDVQRCILAEHQLHISCRVLRNVLAGMGYRYGRGNIWRIGDRIISKSPTPF